MSRQDIPLRALDTCFEGGIPATLCTCDSAGVPNISFLSVVHRVDDQHVALSFQYFRKTRNNLLENPRSRLLVVDPNTTAEFGLDLELVRTETEGPTFERLATALSAIASQTGMTDCFELRGADIHRVLRCERVDNGVTAPLPVRSLDCVERLARCTESMARCSDLDELLQTVLAELDRSLGYSHAFLMAVDAEAQSLFSVASRGYSPSGVGAELELGEGLIGIAARRRSAVLVSNMSRERILAKAVRTQGEVDAQRVIPLPGLPRTESQLVTPIALGDELLGVLCVQSETAAAFGRADEELLAVVANQLATCIARLGGTGHAEPFGASAEPEPGPGAAALSIRHYAEDDSVFVNNDYLIKGVAGRILWFLLCAHEQQGRRAFSNRELRLEPQLGLPAYRDNLETRLIMLRRRLEDRCPRIRIHRTGRGLFELQVGGTLALESVS